MALVGRRPSYSRTSSGSSLTQDDTSGGRTSRVGRLSLEQLSSSSAESSTHSSPVRTTGAAFSTDELRNRFSRTAKTSTASSAVSDTPATVASPRSRFGNEYFGFSKDSWLPAIFYVLRMFWDFFKSFGMHFGILWDCFRILSSNAKYLQNSIINIL